MSYLNDSDTISMLKLRHNLTDITNQVLFKNRKFIVIKNNDANLRFIISPLKKADSTEITAEETWQNLFDRSKLKNISLEKIRITEKQK